MHDLSAESALERLDASPDGLTSAEAARRLQAHGPNALPEHHTSLLALIGRQLSDVLVLILFAALGLALAMPFAEAEPITAASFLDAAVIALILVLNTALGLVQEVRAERAIAALQALSAPRVRVLREGHQRVLPSADLVPGDLVILEAGDRVAADGRLLSSAHLSVDESALTGESAPVHKDVAPVSADAALADRTDMVYAGTLVTRGAARVLVTATGTSTETGRIAHMVAQARPAEGPLQRQLRSLGRMLGLLALGMVALVVAVGLLRSMHLLEILLVAVSLAVSAVPEGLPAVVTVCFALGVRRMTGQNVLTQRLDALETLGAVTTIVTDKTGTLTTNRMVVAEHWVPPGRTAGDLALVGASCNHASLPDLGDPTEIALLSFAEDHAAPRLPIDEEEIPFTSDRKYMRTRHGDQAFVKGAPERVAALCQGESREALEQAAAMAGRGRRVLAAARDGGEGLELVGLFGMEDPPRDGVAEALVEARTAGIRTLVVTGDHLVTARAIAHQVGLDGQAMEGRDLDALDEAGLTRAVQEVTVFARVAPHHKVAICEALTAAGEVVAMTGDGVNDAPALKTAHVGVAMGERGTQVAREAAAIVLADDHYATIVRAVREGRRIHDNIRRFVLFLLQANIDELLLILTTLALGLPLPFLPIHVLWVNLLTDGLPALALASEQAEPDVMQRPPRDRTRHLLHGLWSRLVAATLLGYGASLAAFLYLRALELPDIQVQTGVVTTIIVLELLFAVSARSHLPVWRIPPFGNPWLLASIGGVLAIHALLLVTPAGAFFSFEAPPLETWAPLAGLVATAFLALEVFKAVRELVRGRPAA